MPTSVPPPIPAAQPSKLRQNLQTLQAQLPVELAKAKIKEADERQVQSLLDALQSILDRKVATPEEAERQARDYLARGGELRDLLDDLLLPDPGDLLPPGPRSRLGIIFSEDKKSGHAVVTQVLPQYRADKMGVRPGDVLLTLNGQPVTGATLVPMVVKAQRPYVLEVLRGGAKVTLKDPAR
jgi:S1-C subfamily serine protease